MDVKELALAYASALGSLRGTVSGIVKYCDDEISPRVKESLEKALEQTQQELDSLNKDSTLS